MEYRSVRSFVIAPYGGRDPDDVVQEAFLRAQQKWSSLDQHARPDLWVRRDAHWSADGVAEIHGWVADLATRGAVTVAAASGPSDD